MTYGRPWFSQGTPVYSTNNPDYHVITETLLKVALNTIPPPLSAMKKWPYKRGGLSSGVLFTGSVHQKSGLIREVAFGESDLLYIQINVPTPLIKMNKK